VASTLQRMLLDVVQVGNDLEWLPARRPDRASQSTISRSRDLVVDVVGDEVDVDVVAASQPALT